MLGAMRTLTIAAVLSMGSVACGGSDRAPSNGSTTTPTPSNDDRGGTTVNGDPSGTADRTNAARAIVFNEVAAVGTSEWIEIANPSAVAVDLGDYYVADSDKKATEPRRDHAMRFPAGTTIDPGGRILIVASK